MKIIKRIASIVILVSLANFAIWALVNQSVTERSYGGRISGISYSVNNSSNVVVIPEGDIEKDMAALEGHASTIRLYGMNENVDKIVSIAARHNLNVTLGVWISDKSNQNSDQLDQAIALIHTHSNVKKLIVGNEALLREDITVSGLIDLIEKAKRQIPIPVSTAEPWHIWLEHPELAESVDFITVHILPYWEGVPIGGAVGYTIYRYRQLQEAYPKKHIYIGESGWPSEGQWVKGSEPSQINQAKFIRDFLNVANDQRLDYSIVEAFDQPWKRKIEGSVGAHWGLWDVNRHPKFSMSGSVVESTRWLEGCLIAFAIAFLPIQWFIRRRRNLRWVGQLFFAALIQAVASVFVWAIMAAVAEKIISGYSLTWGLLLSAQGILLALLLVDGFELTEVLWAHERRRDFKPHHDWEPSLDAPKVSIHVPCYNEPPAMVLETLHALSQLKYPNFEVIVVDNNTTEEEVWRPVEAECLRLGSQFRFFHLPKWPGFKAGALNFALSQTDPMVEIVGVIDSDYVVDPNWLKATIPYFNRPEVGFVQAPQDYRDGQLDFFKRMCYWEYAGFFHIGMVQRNERNAIIQHGTMTLIRKSALKAVDGWAEWCICEDAELGLRLFEHNQESVYVPNSFGKGLIPDSFSSYKAQRFRWAYGAVQILKRHWRSLSEGDTLTRGQRYHFISGWLPWFADAAHVVFVVAAIIWSILLMMKLVEFPPAVFLIPTLSVFVFKVVAGFWLYYVRVKCGWRDRLGAAIAGMALSHAVARAVWQGLLTSNKPFLRTPKCTDRPMLQQFFLMAREECLLLISLLVSAIAVLIKFTVLNQNACLWAGMLMVQTLPYWAAIILSAVNVRPFRTGPIVTV